MACSDLKDAQNLMTPAMMLLRLALEEHPPVWQVRLSVVLTVAATVLIVYAAGKIVRTDLLIQGKGITLGELVRWVRA